MSGKFCELRLIIFISSGDGLLASISTIIQVPSIILHAAVGSQFEPYLNRFPFIQGQIKTGLLP